MEHTPAPWKIEVVTDTMRKQDGYSASDFFLIKSLDHMNLATIHGWSPEHNAKLIAAAPRLLAALKAIVEAEEIDLYVGDEWDNAKEAIKEAIG